MKKIVIAGAGQMGKAAARLMDPNRVEFLGYADNDPDKWTESDGSMPQHWDSSDGRMPVFSLQTAVELNPDEFLISALDREGARAIAEQLKVCRFYGDIVQLRDIYDDFDIRSRCLRELAERLTGVQGDAAEVGVYKGDLAWQINELMPDRDLYLFDTFEGFNEADLVTERAYALSNAEAGEFSDTSVGEVLCRMSNPINCHIRKGHFPETLAGLENKKFAFVSMDPDLYEPAFAGMEFFYPRLNEGGIMIIGSFNNTRFRGVRQAVRDYERELISNGGAPLKMVPLGDLHGSCVIIK